MNKEFFYPLWLRFWHWLNALLFLVLIISGLSLHYSDPTPYWIPFVVSVMSHNIACILLSLNYLLYTLMNIVSGNWKQYIPKFKGIVNRMYRQGRFYLMGIFIGEPHPFPTTKQSKFNPLQQIAYFIFMFLLMPVLCISGFLLMFPELAPEEMFGMGGVWPMAFAHTILGYLLSLFMVGHIYLGTTGATLGELYKSMITGWHLKHDEHHEVVTEHPTMTISELRKKRFFPVVFYNPMTITGSLISILSFVIILFLSLIEFFVENPNPYLGIVTFVVLPTILLAGLFLIALGAIKENRRILTSDSIKQKLPVIDLNNPKHQISVIVFSVGTIVLVIASVVGSFKGYVYTDSDEFCGTVCHVVMEPEYTAYLDSPHSRVGCVKCHIGPGTDWFVRSKLSGSYQVYSVLFKKYSKPIPTPVEALRPAPQTCEQCHWPEKFYHEKKMSFDFFTQDEANSEYKFTMNFKVGGGSPELGNNTGIHWVMNIANEVTYYAADKQRNIIPWIRVRSKLTGKETIYRDTTYNIAPGEISADKLRVMDCIDCHNRPSHIYQQPNRTINSYMSLNLIDRNLPYIKNLSLQALETYARSRKTSHDDIQKFIWNFYNKNYPDVAQKNKGEIKKSINHLNKIYLRNYFPDMNVNWKNYPNNLGHMYSPGCFRCHDGKHFSDEGKVISNDCNVCHTMIYQKLPNQEPIESANGIQFIHPGGVDKIADTKNCVTCHGAFPNKKDVINFKANKLAKNK